MRKMYLLAACSGRNSPSCDASIETRHPDKLRFDGLDGFGSVAGQSLRKKSSKALGEKIVRVHLEVDEAVLLYLCLHVNPGEAPKR